MRIDPKIKKDFDLTDEQLHLMEMLQKEAEDLPVPLALEPDMIAKRLPSKQKAPVWKVLSPIMAAAVACFAVIVVGRQTLWNVADPQIEADPPGTVSTVDGPQTAAPNEFSQQPADSDANKEGASGQPGLSPQAGTTAGGTGLNQSPAPQVNPSKAEGGEALPSEEEKASSNENPSGGEIHDDASEYGDIFLKVKELNGKNPAQVKGVARAANFSALFGSNSSLMSARQTDTGNQTDTAQFDGKYIYAISERLSTGGQSVAISRVDGSDYQMAAELFVDFGMENNDGYEFTDVRLLNCYVSQGRLTVVGSAYYRQPEGEANSSDMMTAIATYDISNPERPVLISNSYQDGTLLSSRVSGGFLYLVTRKTVSNPEEEKVQSYVPLQMTGGEYETIGADDIHISQYAESPCYIVASSVLLKEPESFYDTIAVLGDSSELYVNDNNIYLADYSYQNGYTYTSVVKVGFGKGNFDFAGETELLGRLFDSEAMDEYQGVLRVITTCGEQNILYTLDQHLNRAATVNDVAGGEKIKSIRFSEEEIYFVTTDDPDQVTVIDVSDPSQPAQSRKMKLPNHVMPMVPFGDGQMANLEISSGENPGLSLSLYDMLSSSRIIEITTSLVVEGDVYSEAIDNQQALLTIPERGLVGFSYMKYDGAKGESGCCYALYQLSAEGVVKKVEYQYPDRVYNQRGFVKDNVLYVTSTASLVAFNIDSGKLLWEIKY